VQTGELLETTGIPGVAFTAANVVLSTLVHPFTVTLIVYVPVAAVVAPAILGFCSVDVNPFGPLQEYIAPATLVAKRLSVLPAQIGELLEALGAVGIGLITATVVAAAEGQPRTVTVTE
jgi:high-affinity K+ transport system ATPase subunit B